MVPPGGQMQCYQTNVPPASQQRDSAFLQSLDFPQLRELVKDSDATGCSNDLSKVSCFKFSSAYFYYAFTFPQHVPTLNFDFKTFFVMP